MQSYMIPIHTFYTCMCPPDTEGSRRRRQGFFKLNHTHAHDHQNKAPQNCPDHPAKLDDDRKSHSCRTWLRLGYGSVLARVRTSTAAAVYRKRGPERDPTRGPRVNRTSRPLRFCGGRGGGRT
ncbi:hypothetical protein SKAU_G00405240 [Synaphobranchus kaupii]|uniref:Uncharacterized protein n=1 Tax=Synaphobranchus kaupii TaxID=118154 RepID=A0A9Q1E9T2_SYNKA|nr:hypothetical protein SKAU_G00405240 [Synaphobranchus kaupii]